MHFYTGSNSVFFLIVTGAYKPPGKESTVVDKSFAKTESGRGGKCWHIFIAQGKFSVLLCNLCHCVADMRPNH